MCVQVYDVAIETIFLAFCYDCEAHGGHPRHAPQLLLSTVETRSMMQRRGGSQRDSQAHRQDRMSVAQHSRSSEAHQERISEAHHERRSQAQYEYDA